MSAFRLQLWREWREHRVVLLALFVLLPVCTWLLSLPIPRGQLGDPVFHAAVSLGFALVGLVAIGGELLGSERRGAGARWLERLPAGLECAFRAKLVFLALTLSVTAMHGYGAGWLTGVLREAQSLKERQLGELLGVLAALVVTVGAWTFANSAWALRGGLSLMAAALVLALLGLPAWRVIEGGYRPRAGEVIALAAVLVSAALVAAWLGFVRGAKLGRGPGFSALLGLAPALPVLLGLVLWSESKLAERDALDPLAPSFRISTQHVSADGRTAFVLGQHDLRQWSRQNMRFHALRVDLEDGSHEILGQVLGEEVRFREDARKLRRPGEFVFPRAEGDPLVFDAGDGSPRDWEPVRSALRGWIPRGLGIELYGSTSVHAIRDPFRGREYPLEELDESWLAGTMFVRPGRWLHESVVTTFDPERCERRWFWLDPDTRVRVAVDWPAQSEPLVLLEDGRILLADAEGLRWIHPETGTVQPIDSQGLTAAEVLPNAHGQRVPLRWRNNLVSSAGTVVLMTSDGGWLVLPEGSNEARHVPVDGARFVHLLGPEVALVQPRFRSGLARLDLVSGEITPLWPRVKLP